LKERGNAELSIRNSLKPNTGVSKMDHNMVEQEVIKEGMAEFAATQLRELSDLQLAYVGGGIGTTVL
jgi:hypothetical protein